MTSTPPSFASARIQRLEPLWSRMLAHPFLIGTRDGTIPDATFARWMRQDYLFVEAAIPFLGALLARGPARHRGPLADAIDALRQELELFRERAAALGIELEAVRPSFICHAYIQYLMATAHGASYEEAYAVLYTAERAYHDSWKVVQAGIDPASPWLPFVENWAGEAFAGYVAYLEGELEALAEAAGPATRERMARHIELTTRYEIAFWQMALEDEGWPGVPLPDEGPDADRS